MNAHRSPRFLPALAAVVLGLAACSSADTATEAGTAPSPVASPDTASPDTTVAEGEDSAAAEIHDTSVDQTATSATPEGDGESSDLAARLATFIFENPRADRWESLYFGPLGES